MPLFTSPEEHAENPPDTWQIIKSSGRSWTLATRGGTVFDTFGRKRDAETATASGFYVELYEKEKRWYAGEKIDGWRSWEECHAALQRVRRFRIAPKRGLFDAEGGGT